MKKGKPVAGCMGSIPKATAMNPHAKGGAGIMNFPVNGNGGQHLKMQTGMGQELKLSKLD